MGRQKEIDNGEEGRLSMLVGGERKRPEVTDACKTLSRFFSATAKVNSLLQSTHLQP